MQRGLEVLCTMKSNQLLCMAFATPPLFRANGYHLINKSKSLLKATTIATGAVTQQHQHSLSNNDFDEFHPLGPPSFLSNLPTGESFNYLGKSITRLSSLPDIFLVRSLISKDDRDILMQTANSRGMSTAGTRKSGENTIRKGSYLTWIDPYCLDSSERDEGAPTASEVAREIITKSRKYFSHEVMNDLISNVDMIDYAFVEDMQVAKYDIGGRFDYHHDGYGRYLTVLSYVNGIGGTYFPFGNMPSSDLNGIDFTNEDEVSVLSFKNRVKDGRCGILTVGREGIDAYLKSTPVRPKNIVELLPGDAIAFYNYDINGEKDLRTLHCSLPVPEEKWIATCWYRSEALTGPFGYLKRSRLFSECTEHIYETQEQLEHGLDL